MSDSMIISIRYDQPASVFHVLFDLLHLCATAIRCGILLRVGIVTGLVCHDGKKLFGPAMNNAYHLESTVSKYPRIILSEEIIQIGQQYHNDTNDTDSERNYILSLLKRDEDGFYVVDYFDAIEYEFVNGCYDYPDHLESIEKLIFK